MSVAVTVAFPVFLPRSVPFELTVTTAGFELFHFAFSVPPLMRSLVFPPTCRSTFVFLNAGFRTVSLHCIETPFLVAVTVAFPGFIALTMPLLLTETIFLLLVFHVVFPLPPLTSRVYC